MLTDESRSARGSNPSFIDPSLEGVASGDGGQGGDGNPSVGDSDDFATGDSAQVLRQVLFEFSYAHVHVDTLILM